MGDVISTSIQLLETTARIALIGAFFYWIAVFVFVHQKLVRASEPNSVFGYIESGSRFFPTSLLVSVFFGISLLTELGKDV